jgi:hypothetical protein
MNMIRERKSLVGSSGSPRGRYGLVTADSMSLVSWEGVPLVRRWLGDHQYRWVVLYDSASDEIVERYQAAFLEAIVGRFSEVKKLLPKNLVAHLESTTATQP